MGMVVSARARREGVRDLNWKSQTSLDFRHRLSVGEVPDSEATADERRNEYMNTRAKKLLAVMAILTFAFSVIAVAEETSAEADLAWTAEGYTGEAMTSSQALAIENGSWITIDANNGYQLFGKLNVYYSSTADGERTLLQYGTDYTLNIDAEDGKNIVFSNNTANGKFITIERGTIPSNFVKVVIDEADDFNTDNFIITGESTILGLKDKYAYTFDMDVTMGTTVTYTQFKLESGAAAFNVANGVNLLNYSTEQLVVVPKDTEFELTGYGFARLLDGSAWNHFSEVWGILNVDISEISSCGGFVFSVKEGGTLNVYDGTTITNKRIGGGSSTSSFVGGSGELNWYGGKFISSSSTNRSDFTGDGERNIGLGEYIPTVKRPQTTKIYEGKILPTIGKLRYEGLQNESAEKVKDIVEMGGAFYFKDCTYTETDPEAACTVGEGTTMIIESGSTFTMLAADFGTGAVVVNGGTLNAENLTTVSGILSWEHDYTNLTVKNGATIVLNGMEVTATSDSVISYAKDSHTLTLASGNVDIQPITDKDDDVNAAVILVAENGKATFNGIVFSGTGSEMTLDLGYTYTLATDEEEYTYTLTAGTADIAFEKAATLGADGLAIAGAANATATVTVDATNGNLVTLKSGAAVLSGTATAESTGGTTLALDGGVATINGSVIQKSGSAVPTMTLTTGDNTIEAELASGAVSVAMKAESTYEDFTALKLQ